MSEVSLAEARSGIDALILRVGRGEVVDILDEGRLVARLVAPEDDAPVQNAPGELKSLVEEMRRLTERQRLEGRTELDPQAFWDEMRGRNRD